MVLDSDPGKSFLVALNDDTLSAKRNTTISLIYDNDNHPVEMELEDVILLNETNMANRARFLETLMKNGIKNMCGGCAYCKEGKGTDSMNLAPRYKQGLEFHHIFDPSKSFDPSHHANFEVKIAEMKKCILLCRSCHFYITHIPSERTMFDNWIRENLIYYYDETGKQTYLKHAVYDEEDSDNQEEWMDFEHS